MNLDTLASRLVSFLACPLSLAEARRGLEADEPPLGCRHYPNPNTLPWDSPPLGLTAPALPDQVLRHMSQLRPMGSFCWSYCWSYRGRTKVPGKVVAERRRGFTVRTMKRIGPQYTRACATAPVWMSRSVSGHALEYLLVACRGYGGGGSLAETNMIRCFTTRRGSSCSSPHELELPACLSHQLPCTRQHSLGLSSCSALPAGVLSQGSRILLGKQ